MKVKITRGQKYKPIIVEITEEIIERYEDMSKVYKELVFMCGFNEDDTCECVSEDLYSEYIAYYNKKWGEFFVQRITNRE